MSDLYIFEYGDPKEILLPEQFLPNFDGCASFSENILESRSREVIINTMRDLDIEINRRSVYELEDLYCINKRPELKLEYMGTCTGRFGIIALMFMFKDNDTSALKSIDNPTWAEIYAIYTLGLVAYANRDLDIYESTNELNKEEYLFELAGYYLAEAVETSTIAHLLTSDMYPFKKMEEALVGFEQHKTQRAKSGGVARSEKYKPLKMLVLDEYLRSHTEKSNNQAAGDIWRLIPNKDKMDREGRMIIAEHNAVQTLSRWIAQAKREQIKTI